MKKDYEKNIHERIYKFVIRVLKLVKQLPKTPENLIIMNQITRSVTSIGANDREADGSTSIKDFLHCYTVVRKEAKETDYWLHVIADMNKDLQLRMHDLLAESEEIIKVVTSIIYNTKQKQ